MRHFRELVTGVTALFAGVMLFAASPLECLAELEGKKASRPELIRQTYRHTITIADQEGFDRIKNIIVNAARSGEHSIKVTLSPGIYYFHDLHLDLSGFDFHDLDLCLEGPGATVVAEGRQYVPRNEIYPNRSYLDARLQNVDIWTEAFRADADVEILDEATGACRVKCLSLDNRSLKECSGIVVRLTEWYLVGEYSVSRIDGGYLYFTADDLRKHQTYGWNVNYDMWYGHQYPHFKLAGYNTGPDLARECSAVRFFRMDQTSIHGLLIKDLSFAGNGMDSDKCLMEFYKCDAERIEICGCSFEGHRSNILAAGYTQNIFFHQNTIRHNHLSGIVTYNTCKHVCISDNYFEECGLAQNQSSCVIVSGDEYYVTGNTFKNFGYNAVRVGCSYIYGASGSGIVEDNVMFYTEDYLSRLEDKTIMDGGAVYAMTCNTEAIIRYNYIHEYAGRYDNRGIFLDDGSSNVKIYGNIICNVADNWRIDSRKATQFETVSGSAGDITNVGNVIMYNVVDGRIRFVGRDGENGCIKGSNVVLLNPEQSLPENQFGNLLNPEDDAFLICSFTSGNRLYVPRRVLRTIKKLPCYQDMAKYIVGK